VASRLGAGLWQGGSERLRERSVVAAVDCALEPAEARAVVSACLGRDEPESWLGGVVWEEVVEGGGCLVLQGREDVRVGVECDPDRGVAEPLRDDFGVDALG
jgi:hypothetical protein